MLAAEWRPQSAVLLVWPHESTDWQPYLQSVIAVYVQLAEHISQYEKVLLVCQDQHHEDQIQQHLQHSKFQSNNITFLQIKTNDTWVRDCGPLISRHHHKHIAHDFQFNAWGQPLAFDLDNQLTTNLIKTKAIAVEQMAHSLVLEGGNIESNNHCLMLNQRCLLDPNRNTKLAVEDIEQTLINTFAAAKILWITEGLLAGDDTGGHIDTLARFTSENTICYVQSNNHNHQSYQSLSNMAKQLGNLTDQHNQPFTLIPLPMPQAIFHQGMELPASYANFLIINQAVLVPVFQDQQDDVACQRLAEAFPERSIIPVDARPLILQGGGIHCATMQIPEV
jgi:agmatine/peptidylarginine deiminase